jgi:hypothetical protein
MQQGLRPSTKQRGKTGLSERGGGFPVFCARGRQLVVVCGWGGSVAVVVECNRPSASEKQNEARLGHSFLSEHTQCV